MAISTMASALDLKHATWDQWLKKFANVEGPVTTVDYKAATKDHVLLDKYLSDTEAVTKAQFDALSNQDKLAFLINAYNAFTVRLIVLNYPISSIKDTGSVFKSPWKKKFFTLFGEEQSLDGIEHGTIRKDFTEPRIHFAVVCASKGCPALRGEAFVGDKLEEQLESNAQLFLKDSVRNRFVPEENKFYLSKIFDWYGDDFKKKFGSVQAFVAPRMPRGSALEAKMKEASITFLEYDWTLNQKN